MKAIYLTLFTLFFSTAMFGQFTVSGVVKDDAGLEMIGVTILEQGNEGNGTITDIDGSYSLSVASGQAILVFSYTGYETIEVAIDGKADLPVTLSEDVANLEEVVVVGYGVQKKSVTTGAISKIKSSDLESMPVQRIEQSLQGRTSGVRVTSGSGQPGSGATVRIRGTTTIANSDPLYVVDGIPIEGGIDYLSQGDVESIEVLKDAASAAIYGSRAANGVIIVTTKKGQKNTMSINYHGYYGVQNPYRKLRLLNATEYGTLLNESSAAAGEPILFEDPQSLGEGTDWQDAVFAEDSPMQNHEISISAGSDKSTYYASFSYFDQDGIIGPDDSNYKRYTLRFNSNHELTDKLTFGNTFSYTRNRSQGISTNSEFGSPLGRAINIDPITPVYETREEVLNSSVFQNFPVVSDENGVFGISELVTSEILNPLAALEVAQGFGHSDKLVGNLFAEYEFIKGLKFRSSYGADIAFWGGEGFTPIHYLNSSNRVDQTSYGRNSNRGFLWTFENTLSYSNQIGDHTFSILAGTSAQRNRGEGISGTITNVPFTNLEEASLNDLFAPIENQTYGGFEYEDKLSSIFGRLNYNFKEKYLFSAVLRRDGSSKFLKTRQFATFPSVSLGWVVTEEGFWNNNPMVNFLKIRGSWGINGNNKIDNNAFLATVGDNRTYTFGVNDDLINGVSPNRLANPRLKWEQTSQLNFGFDAKLFKKFSLTFDYFRKETSDMLLSTELPGFFGNTGPIANIATMENRGYEFELGYRNRFGKFQFDLVGNISYVENEVTFLTNDTEFLPGQRFGPQGLEITRTSVGLPIGYLYGFKSDGLFQNQAEVDAHVGADGSLLQPEAAPGDIRFIDFNGDGILDNDDRTMIGDPTPTWTYGFNLSASYQGFDLIVFAQGVAGNDVFNATRRFDLPKANYTADALERWTGEGTSNFFPRLVLDDPNQNFSRSSDFYVEDGGFFRIKTLQLGYSLPDAILEKLNINRLRFYVSGNNIFTATKYSGFDPEVGDGGGVDRGIYPQPRFYLAGVNLTF